MRLITKTVNKYVLIVVVAASLLIPFLTTQVHAAQVYKGPCDTAEGNFSISPPFEKDGKSYDCVRNVNNGDWVPTSKPGDPCPFGASGWDAFGLKACLLPNKVTVSAKNNEPPKFVKSDCNTDENLNATNCGIVAYLVLGINVLSAVVGVVIVLMIIVGGIEYSSAGDDPQKVSAAKGKITNALLALFLFIFMYGLLQWLVPGGIF